MSDKINGRTPEEIKLRLACIFAQDSGWCEDQESCEKCEYNVSGIYTEEEAARDSLILIQQLEHERDAAVAEIESLNAEIDAINEDYLSCIHTVREDAQPKWISVDERLPEYGKKVQAAFPCYNGYHIEHATLSKHGEREIWYIGDLNAVGGTPTHWMPLPEPPKEE